MVPQVFGLIRSSLDDKQRGAALGAYGAIQGVASIAGPLLGGVLVSADLLGLGWRTIFWVNVPVGLIALLVGMRTIPDSKTSSTPKMDWVGALVLAGSLTLILLPIVQGTTWGWPLWGWVLMSLGLGCTALFLALEHRIARNGGQPVLNPALLKHRGFAWGLLASFAFFGGIASFFLLLSLYLQSGTGRSALTTGLITMPYALGSMLTSTLGIKPAERHGREMLIAGSLIIGGSHLVMWFVVTQASPPAWWQLGLPLFMGGLGLGLAAPPLVNVVLSAVPVDEAAAAGGVLSTINQIGGSAGVAAFGALFFTTIATHGREGPLEAFDAAYAAILPLQAVLYFLAAGLMTRLPKTNKAA